MKITKRFLLLLLLVAAAETGAFAQNKEQPSATNKATPAITYEMLVSQYNFPVKKNIGNPERDQQVYAAAKRKWMEANKDLYEKYKAQGIKGNPNKRKSAQPKLAPSK